MRGADADLNTRQRAAAQRGEKTDRAARLAARLDAAQLIFLATPAALSPHRFKLAPLAFVCTRAEVQPSSCWTDIR